MTLFQNLTDPTGRPMFSNKFDSSGQDSKYETEAPSTTPGTRYCISVIDENTNWTNSYMDSQWSAFRTAWPNRPFYLLNPTAIYSGSTPIYDTVSPTPGPTGGYISANPNFGTLWIPGTAYSDNKFHYYPVTREEWIPNIPGLVASDWVALTGVNLLPAGAKVGLFVDNSGSMYTSTVQTSYDNFVAYCNTHSIDIIVVTNQDEDWIAPFITMAGD